MLFYSLSERGFFDTDMHEEIPADCVQITKEYHRELLNGQGSGKQIVPDQTGYPILVDPPAITNETLLQVAKNKRKAAYADEADPLFFKMHRGEATMQEWQNKITEIKAKYPYPI